MHGIPVHSIANGFHGSGIDIIGLDWKGYPCIGRGGAAGAGNRVADATWRLWSAPEGGGPWPMAAFRSGAGVKMGLGRLVAHARSPRDN